RRFWRLELPFAMPGLIWNMMMSMSGAWFFVVASEAITVRQQTIALPGIGSWLSVAIDRRDFAAVGWAVSAMIVVILLYDQLLFRPIVAWADKFRFEQTASSPPPRSWLYDALRRTRLFRVLRAKVEQMAQKVSSLDGRRAAPRLRTKLSPAAERRLDRVWLLFVIALAGLAAAAVVQYMAAHLSWHDVLTAFGLGFITLARVLVLIALASLIWVPIGVWLGLRPVWARRAQPIAQFLAAFPANLLFPPFVLFIVYFHLSPDIWLTPLMVLGTQWYILFNVVAGAAAFPGDLKEASSNFRISGWLWWRKVIIPGIFPYYITGAITASGGSWNAAIVAEVASWGDTKLQAHGLGAYIADATDKGDMARVVLGVVVMSAFVVLFNRLLWRPMYAFAQRRLTLA
ncbi:MAG: binding-protein-dependent transport system inner rane component, partial [Rhodopila sp.]|nr:binding-protein-dependent transport system inner rane component [Rhodopila sp.]